MKIDLLDIDRLIDVNNLQEVSSPRLFSTKMTYDQGGILSNEIFGYSKNERKSTFAYISLKRKFIHPHIYQKVLKPMFRAIIYIIAGQKRFVIKNGLPVEDSENGWTGLEELYNHWDEIDWKKSKSTNVTNKQLLTNPKLTKDKVFIDKIPVCPPAYRDVMLSGTVDSSDHVNELNTLYTTLIRSVALLSEGGLFARTQYSTQLKIQDQLVEIMNYFKKQVSKKQGLIRKNLIGKSVDYGVRTVISAPSYNYERFEDSMVDLEHTAVPIYQCCSLFYPFIESWVKNFFTREVINDPNSIVFYDNEEHKEIIATVNDPDNQFSDKSIRKLINDYCFNPDNRFRILEIETNVSSNRKLKTVKAGLRLKGKIMLPNNISKELDREMTLTDLLYLACVDVCEKRHVMVSRYPVGTDKGIYFARIRVQSTSNHIKVIFNGKEYPFYPDIDLETPQDKVSTKFIDTLVMSNSHLDGMGADYDGDQLSVRGIYSDEANEECEIIMKSKASALNITGTNAKAVAKEVFNSLYELTKDGPTNGVLLNNTYHEIYLKLKPEDITRSLLTDLFADTVNNENGNKSGKHKSRHNTWDKFKVPANYFYNGQPEIATTIGRFIVNKFILESSGCINSTLFINKTLNKGAVGNLDNLIAQLYMENVIDRKAFNSYVDHRDTIGYWANGMLAHTISEKMLKPLPAIEKKKAELCKKYKDELEAGNIDIMTQIDHELVDYAKEILKGDPGMDLYDSGDLSFENNYKNNAIIKGAVINKITNGYDFIQSSFMDGIDIKDIPAHANSILASQYPSSIATKVSGYIGKKILALLQMMEIDEPGTDCKTKNLIPLTITNTNKNDVIYTIIEEGGQQKMITKDNVSSYIGKTIMMRTPMSCGTDKICSKCAGNLFYLLDIRHAGLFGVQISHSSLNLALKAKHDSTIDLYYIDPERVIEDIN